MYWRWGRQGREECVLLFQNQHLTHHDLEYYSTLYYSQLVQNVKRINCTLDGLKMWFCVELSRDAICSAATCSFDLHLKNVTAMVFVTQLWSPLAPLVAEVSCLGLSRNFLSQNISDSSVLCLSISMGSRPVYRNET